MMPHYHTLRRTALQTFRKIAINSKLNSIALICAQVVSISITHTRHRQLMISCLCLVCAQEQYGCEDALI